MGSNGANEISMGHEAEGSETTIEIKIKTLDSQTYTLRVNKEVPVPDLKEQIASVTGVLSEQQRLICRGKVLKDDQLLSAYHVEDGHTLHLVARQAVPPSSESLPSHPGTDPASSTSRNQRIQIAPGIVVETFNMPDQADGVHPDINRIVTAVLGSFGINTNGRGSEGVDVHEHGSERRQTALGAGGLRSSTQLVPEEAGMRGQSDRSHGPFGLQTSVPLGHLQPHVIPDSLTTLSQYLSRMRQEYGDNDGRNDAQAGATDGTGVSLSGSVQQGLPTPSLLADILSSTREMLIEQAAENLLQLGRQLRNQSNVTDPMVRLNTQSNAWRSGILFQNLGAFLLELGRTTMTVRMGQTPSEAVVNAGPAVYISQSGPNPLMVQPLPFQPGSNFGSIPTGSGHTGSGLVHDFGAGFLPRHVEIHIRRGSSTARANANQEERAGSQRASGQTSPAMNGSEFHVSQATSGVPGDPSHTAAPGVRLVPIGTMVAAVPGPLGRLPVLGRFQHVASGLLSSRRGSQTFGEYRPNGFQTELQSGSGLQHNIEHHARDTNSTNSGVEQGPLPAPNSRSFNINVHSTGGSGNNQESESEVPSEILQYLRTLFPGSEIQVGDAVPLETATGSVAQNAGTTSGESRESDEGIFLSNLLQQIMPFISQLSSGEPNLASSEAPNVSEQRTEQDSSSYAENSDIGTSRRQNDVEPSPPNSKRQKME
ncbi:ubiquitin-like domain-containing protein CIP73 isoform X2 [Cornus florida]|uniref:ubiquitin-like domain-containing protein CIP73 isoform X2 n=1 Tax=Cornus florida TaxID=4283 RepID=UPI00289789B8|nr:ubiquitin-like domain-containing protein CIP73 isoform X2 [Cornus florida]